MITDDPIECYLDEVLLTAPGNPRQVRRTLAEIEDHLLEAAESGRLRGLEPDQARAEAVRRFGPAAAVMDRPASLLRPPRGLRRRLALTALFVAGWAGVTVGLAGAIALVIKLIWGSAAIATAFPAGSYDAADCTRWLAAEPAATGCQAAMISDHADDFIRNAAVALIVGVLALLVRFALLRRWKLWQRTALEAGLTAGLAGVITIGFAAIAFDDMTVTHGQGAGQPLSLAVAALLATVGLAGWAGHAAGRPLFCSRPA